MRVERGPLQGLMINRLLVLFQIIAIPVYFFFFTWKWRENLKDDLILIFDKLSWIPFLKISDFWIWFIIWVGIPLFFSAPFLLFSILRANKIANTYELMGRALGRVRIDQKLFYGLNAFFVILFILLPVMAPLLSFLAAIYVAWKITKYIPFFSILRFLVFAIIFIVILFIPAILAGAFFMEFMTLFTHVYNSWISNVDLLYGIGLCLADSVAIGNFWLLIKEGGAQVTKEKVPYTQVLLLKVFAFAFFLVLFFYQDPTSSLRIIDVITLLATILAGIELIIRWRRPMSKNSESKFGFIMIPVFTVVNFLKQISGLKSLVIILAALIFFALFFLAYRYADDEELFK